MERNQKPPPQHRHHHNPVRLNYWDGRGLFKGEDVPADFITVYAADVSATKTHFKENGHYGSSHLILGGKYLLDTEKAYANSVLDTSGYVTTNTGRTFITRDAGFHMSTLAICGGIIAFTDEALFQAWRSHLNDEYKHLVDEAERTIGEYLGEEMTILTFPLRQRDHVERRQGERRVPTGRPQ